MSKQLLIIGFVWPEPKSSAAGSRMLQLIQQFQTQDYHVTFASAAKPSDNTFDLSRIAVTTKRIVLNDSSFDVFVAKLQPDIVLFDRFMIEEQYGWRVAETCPNTIRILDTEDFHGLRKARELALKANVTVDITHLQNTVTKREIASMYRCDLSLIISEVEMRILTQQFNIDASLLFYIPFLVVPAIKSKRQSLPSFASRRHFISIGNFLHPPNYDATLYLKQMIWPLISKALPEAQLHIYGAYESHKVRQLHNTKTGFLIKGFVNRVSPVMESARVCLAPLRFGAGLKGKLIDAMQNGTPCIMSSIASEGLFGQLEPNGYIADNATIFAKKAIDLYTNADTWQHFQEYGFRVLDQRFNPVDFKATFAARIAILHRDLKAHRKANFIGQLLQHQSLQSTKYMSKWIAEKNKNPTQ